MSDNLRVLVFEVKPSVVDAASGVWRPAATGWVGLVATVRGLRLLTLPVASYEKALEGVRNHYPDVPPAADDDFLQSVARQVQAYLVGELRTFNVELDLRGNTTFALAVWFAAARIPYGETRSYGWVAYQVGGVPGAAQAAGAALGANPVPLIIPCHRVVGSDGDLHGFGGGLDMKTRLLAMESGQAAFEWKLEA